ncbi:MAG: MiaB/RimO family radical SAM methylthiotransferase [Candidatus Lokiarchaeota archaeon]|nr:MiaB/RimO family radical SAM methylthiotransferase [Candidatus Lokiarchaeota archaeon]
MIYPRTYYIETYGCTFNHADSAKLNQILLNGDFLPSSIHHAEFIIINTCGVKSQTEAKILHRIRTLSLKSGQKILVTGCLPFISDDLLTQIQMINQQVQVIFDCHSYTDLLNLLPSLQNSSEFKILRSEKSLKKSEWFPWSLYPSDAGIVQISEGCDKLCTYCCTRISRGKPISYPLDSILSLIKFYISEGAKEIFLTAQDCGLYQWDSYTIVDLIQKIEEKFNESELFIRIGMIDPFHSSKILDLAKIIKNSSIFYKFLHIPIQSASSRILRLMKRGYSHRTINSLFDTLQELGITISTDIICGFPEETDEDFQETYEFVKNFQPDVLNISKFTARPNTKAKEMKQLDSQIIKQRTQLLTSLYLDYIELKNITWKDWQGKILIRGYLPNKPYPYSGRTEYYKTIAIPNGKINDFVYVTVKNANSQFLLGELVDAIPFEH